MKKNYIRDIYNQYLYFLSNYNSIGIMIYNFILQKFKKIRKKVAYQTLNLLYELDKCNLGNLVLLNNFFRKRFLMGAFNSLIFSLNKFS